MASVSWIGQTLNGRYHIESLLGQGGMSSVYKAFDPNLRRTVAIKMIHPHLSNNLSFMRRFEEEAAIVAQLRHEHIVQVFDFNHDDDAYYMVLEFIPGETLEARLKRLNEANRRLDIPEAVNYISQVCEAISYAHAHGMIHRDIKPANIMLDIFGKAILMDFGIARMVGGQLHTAAGAVLGTALYMSPEQIKGEKVDERADIYSLGVTLFETLTGRPPFEADTAMTLMMMHLNDPVPDIQELHPQVPDRLVAVVCKALEKNCEDRFSSATEMADALSAAMKQLTDAAAPSPVQTQVEENQPDLQVDLTSPDIPDQRPLESHTQALPSAAVSQAEVEAPSPQAAPGNAATSRPARLPLLVGGCALLAVVALVAVLVFAILPILNQNDGIAGISARLFPTRTAAPALETPVNAAASAVVPLSATSDIGILPINESTPSPVTVIAPSPTSPAAAGGNQPTVTVPADRLFARIDSITVENGRYVVGYETFGFTETLPGTHIHFFFNDIPPDQAGLPNQGSWVLYGGPSPFKGYTVANRPADATQLCVLVANPNHTIQSDSGNCFDLP